MWLIPRWGPYHGGSEAQAPGGGGLRTRTADRGRVYSEPESPDTTARGDFGAYNRLLHVQLELGIYFC